MLQPGVLQEEAVPGRVHQVLRRWRQEEGRRGAHRRRAPRQTQGRRRQQCQRRVASWAFPYLAQVAE